MTDASHEKRIKKIDGEIVELRKQIMQIEFISKRETAAARRDHEAAQKERDKSGKRIDKRIEHLSLLMGITYDELNLVGEQVHESGRVLARPRKHSTLS